jgi:putative MATE family efflux protein
MQDLTHGSLAGHLVRTSTFMLVSMVFQTLYVLVDLYWVGRLGTEAVAAVGVSSNLMFVVLGATQMLGVGTTALVSHAVGRKDQARAQSVFKQSQVLSLVVGGLFLAVAMALRLPYANRLSADAATAAFVAEYLLWFIPAMAMQFAMVTMGAAMRGSGNFKPGMVVQIATVTINMLLAPVLIFGWGTGVPLGVAGAAIATLIAVAIGVAWMATYFVAPTAYLRFSRHGWRPEPRLWRDMLAIGLPAGAEFALTAVYLVIVYTVARPFGAAAQAGFGIGLRLMQACFLPVGARGFAVAPVAGQNFGARRGDRVRATFAAAARISIPAMFALALALQVAAAPLIAIFTADRQAIAVGAEYLRIIAWNFVPSGLIFVSSSMFQAMGNALPSLVTSFTRIVCVSVPTVWLSTRPGFELRTVWYLSVATVALQLALNLWLLRREFRTRLDFQAVGSA